MDNTAPNQVQNTTPTAENPSGSNDKNSWIKYFSAEVVIVLLVIGVIALFIFKPFGLFGPHLSKTPPSSMNTNVAPNGVKIQATIPPATPKLVVISISQNGFEPQAASISGKNVMLQFLNNTVQPVEIEFEKNSIPTSKVAPNVISNPISIPTSVNFHLKSDSSKTGSLTVN